VIRGYSPALKKMRPLANVWAWTTGGVRLPSVGERIRNAYVSHMVAGGAESDLAELLRILLSAAGHAGLQLLTIAFDVDDPRLKMVRRMFEAREYRSRVYLVYWPDCGSSATGWKHRLMAPEVALL
jgi:hypothetical protein